MTGKQIENREESTTIPVFLYGTLKPGQIGETAVDGLIDAESVEAKLQGYELYTRDGLPFIRKGHGGPVHGALVDATDDLLGRIRVHEGATPSDLEQVEDPDGNDEERRDQLYSEVTVSVTIQSTSKPVRAQAFVEKSRSNRDDGQPISSGYWSASDDPVFSRGFPPLIDSIRTSLHANEDPTELDRADYWVRFWSMQGHYLNLMTILERFSLFAYGPAQSRWRAMTILDQEWVESLASLDLPPVEVYAMNKSDNKRWKSATAPFRTWYQVRSNIVHQGKYVDDFVRVRNAVKGLSEALDLILRSRIDGIEQAWGRHH